jgi:hypothetical protein
MSNKKFWLSKIIGFIICAFAMAAILGYVVMSLWNNILVEVLHVQLISFWQAFGILVLCKILFGGIRGFGWRGGPHGWKKDMQEKWQHMTPEERDKLKEEWRNRCRVWKKPENE